jgi:hypothetical protein
VPDGWSWDNTSGSTFDVTATNDPAVREDSYHGFLSGIVLGVAGAALVVVLQEVLSPLKSARSKRKNETPANGPVPRDVLG